MKANELHAHRRPLSRAAPVRGISGSRGVKKLTLSRSWGSDHCRGAVSQLDWLKELCAMNRRRLAIWMLWLSLFGLAPSAFACSGSARSNDDCCPAGQPSPCVHQAPPTAAATDAGCCAAQPSAQQTTISATPARRLLTLPAPLDPVIGTLVALTTADALFEPREYSSPLPVRFNSRQIYLLTGRLRL